MAGAEASQGLQQAAQQGAVSGTYPSSKSFVSRPSCTTLVCIMTGTTCYLVRCQPKVAQHACSRISSQVLHADSKACKQADCNASRPASTALKLLLQCEQHCTAPGRLWASHLTARPGHAWPQWQRLCFSSCACLPQSSSRESYPHPVASRHMA